jgi:hypothetical protein
MHILIALFKTHFAAETFFFYKISLMGPPINKTRILKRNEIEAVDDSLKLKEL